VTVTESDPSMTGGSGRPPPASGRGRGRSWWVLLLAGIVVATVTLIVLVLVAGAYQPVGLGAATSGGLPGLPRPLHARQVNMFGAQTGELFIPPQRGYFGVSVSLGNWGPDAVTIEAVTMTPPGTGYPWPLIPAGPVLYWTSIMFSDVRHGLPIVGLSLRPGQDNDVYVGIPVRTSSCYIPRAFSVLDSFYVKERFLFFTKWVRVPLLQPLLLNAPADPPNQPAPETVCPGR
jgi:hypothetical protein